MLKESMSEQLLKHLYLIDGSGFIFRAFHALPPLTRADGVQVGAVYGFTNMLLKIIQETDADHLAVIFDAARTTFRHEIYKDYKAHRPPLPPELVPQFELIHQACEAFDIPCFKQEKYEADDLIATYAKQAIAKGADVTIVSSDKDLMQLVSSNVSMRDPLKNKFIGFKEVCEKFGVRPDRVRDVQALAGDSSDNVPGVPGIGLKTAAELIVHYGDLESLLARASEIKQPKRREMLLTHASEARLSYQLVTLKDDVPVEMSLEKFGRRALNPEKIRTFLGAQNFTALISRLTQNGILQPSLLPLNSPLPVPLRSEYELVQDIRSLEQWINKARKVGVVAIDTETDSLNPTQANLVGISLSVEAGKACYIPLNHKEKHQQLSLALGNAVSSSHIKQIPLSQALGFLKLLLEDSSILKVGQNIKYDLHVLRSYGLEASSIEDTMVISYIVDGSLHGHGMDELAKLHLDYNTIKFSEICGKGKEEITFDYVPLEKARDYAAEDADITLRLYHILKPKLLQAKLSSVYETMERPLIPVLLEMESAGIKVDKSLLKTLSHDFSERIKRLEKEIYQLVGQPFNIASPKQLGEILFKNLNLPGGVKNKSGGYTTNIEVMDKLSAEGYEIADKIIQWRQLSKLKNTYTDALIEEINPKTGRVHTSYGMTIANTGRLSSSTPNLQNIPIRTEEGRLIRKAFIADPGSKIVSLDYSQIELRLLTHAADIKPLQQAFYEKIDIHALTASQVFGVSLNQVNSTLRSKAKAINFGIIYGISSFGLARQLGISKTEAKNYINIYFKQYPGIQDFMETQKEFARQHGYVETLFGRRIFTPDINSKNGALKSFAERQAINAPLQGTNADIIKKAMIKIPLIINSQYLKAKMLLQVHDELVFEIEESDVEKASHYLKKVMETVVHLKVPIVVDIGIGKNWDEAH